MKFKKMLTCKFAFTYALLALACSAHVNPKVKSGDSVAAAHDGVVPQDKLNQAAKPNQEAVSKEHSPVFESQFKEGMLWKVEKPGSHPSFILGTIHLSDPRVAKIQPNVAQAFLQVQRVVMEVELKAEAMWQMMGLTLVKEDLKKRIGSSLHKKLCLALKKKGQNCASLNKMKVWTVMATLQLPTTPGLALDMLLYKQALAQKLPVTGLETIKMQVSFFDAIPVDEQINELARMLDNLDEIPKQLELMIKAYVDEDLAKITAMSMDVKEMPPKWYKMLLVDRNRDWLQQLPNMMQRESLLVAVGAAHLVGPEGLLPKLKAQGYAVSRY